MNRTIQLTSTDDIQYNHIWIESTDDVEQPEPVPHTGLVESHVPIDQSNHERHGSGFYCLNAEEPVIFQVVLDGSSATAIDRGALFILQDSGWTGELEGFGTAPFAGRLSLIVP